MMTPILNHSSNKNQSTYQPGRNYAFHNNLQLPLPPYGKEAALLQSWGFKPRNDIYIFIGINGWSKAKEFKNTQVVLCLPYGADPSIYSWPVKDCPVLLIDTGFSSVHEIEKIAYCLLCENAAIVRTVLSNDSIVIYRRENAV